MRFGTAGLLIALVALTAVPSCGQPGSGAQTRVVPAPGDDEDVSNNAFTRTETVKLDRPVGTASVVDLNHEPPTEIKPLK